MSTPLRIGFDVTILGRQQAGIGRATRELLGALLEETGGHHISVLTHRAWPGSEDDERFQAVRRGPGPRLPLRTPWMQGVLPLALWRSSVDVCHFTNYYAPALATRPQVVTFYDMSTFLFPEAHPRRRVAARRLLRMAARSSSAIITPSVAIRNDVVEVLGVDAARVHVVPGAASKAFAPVEDESVLASTATRYGLTPGYLLCLGTVEPRKNLAQAVEALALIRRRGGDATLVIAGGLGWRYQGVLERVEVLGLRERVRFLGYVPEEDLPTLLSMASMLVYPSLYEGFGIPILEAMACGTPVIASNMGATAEVAGDAALLVDVRSTEQVADAIERLLGNPAERARLREAGIARAATFSWRRAAAETLAVYESVANRARVGRQ